MRGCVPGPILAQGHLVHSYHSWPITNQLNSDQVDHCLTLRPRTLQRHEDECGRIVDSDHVRHGGGFDGYYIHTIGVHVIQTIGGQIMQTVYVTRTNQDGQYIQTRYPM